MKINVSGVLRGINSSTAFNGAISITSIDYKGDAVTVNAPIGVKGLITNTGEHLLITGKINADLTLKCSRCLESFSYALEGDFEEELSNKEHGEDIIYFEGDTIDITDIVTNNILLSLPMKFICSETCKGLCPRCGKNLNDDICGCKDEDVDPRLSVLKKYLKDNN